MSRKSIATTEVTTQVEQFILNAETPVSRKEALLSLNLPLNLWKSAVGGLIKSGRVVRLGNKKGAKYTTAPVSTTAVGE